MKIMYLIRDYYLDHMKNSYKPTIAIKKRYKMSKRLE